MNGRKRKIQIKFYVTEEERALIEQKMKLVPIKGQYGGLKPFAKKRIGNKLRADTFLPVVQ